MENDKSTVKRRRGGQPGNQNARRHGFYSTNLSPVEICEFLNATNLKAADRELAGISRGLSS